MREGVLLYTVEKLYRRDMELASMLEFVRYAYPMKLGNYSGRNIDHILQLLYDDKDAQSLSVDNSSVLTRASGRAGDTSQHSTHLEPDDEEESTHNVAHALHFASIAMLGLLVLEVCVTLRFLINSFYCINFENGRDVNWLQFTIRV